MPLDPLLFRPARKEGKRLNNAKRLRELLVTKLKQRRSLEDRRLDVVLKTRTKRDDRSYIWFQHNFELFFGDFFSENVSLIDILETMYFNKNRPLRIADYGGANGNLIYDVANIARHNSLYTDVLVDTEVIDARRRPKDFVGRYTQSLAEEHVFDKPVDILFDNFGPLSYTDFDLRKAILLKHLESLSKGGILFCSFVFYPDKPKYNALDINKNYFVVGKRDYFRAIENAMLKRGFRAKFYPREVRGTDVVNYFLIAQRTDEFPNKNRK